MRYGICLILNYLHHLKTTGKSGDRYSTRSQSERLRNNNARSKSHVNGGHMKAIEYNCDEQRVESFEI